MLDFYALEDLLTPEEKEVQKAARRFLEKEALPHIRDWWEEGVFPAHLIPRFAELGFLGPTLPPEYGGAGVSSAAYGLIAYELERVDSGLRSFVSVQSSLVMYPIYAYGSEAQKREFLPRLARGELVGCFGLTEPDGGSDPQGNMKTRARREGDTWVLQGSKMWITNGNLAHIAIIWAKDEEGRVLGFIVPTDTPGFQAREVKHKMSLRASVTSELILDGVRVPEALRLPKAEGLKAPLSCLTQARFGIAWGVLGALEAVYREAVEFAKSRSTFGAPIAQKQLVQAKLAEMLAWHTEGLLLAWRLARLKDEGRLTPAQVSLAKRQNVRKALEAARLAREILGGSGITLEYHAIRHMLNLETVYTYEGTHEVHTLVLGREATGLNAF
ncbi:MAG: acyl-CoA dehydrogenase family protein [Thermus sp.]|uniref:acyl-CoA dehydrogenase family protein n=1 Tax=Thermus sp. TaxID=275 RepID=UPI0025F70FC3|nr:acyl-CoA dehydrogenase family protein [Thermus sp.]MCS6869405.1 acyl-CoA dehydrogenase family protein [Thermus sp.]MCS7218297.1 acyl-CoA dehydrogenase family protein [Thermus sp.]MCX7849105.1 acyl-CoA dehydrogenase family protein [Thermus sp.]MDW8016281.1 acyl-CoA dehydrogenase family protein [Thermus sp.]MDW8356707.1 acyl-CoA dehydrogenase family protein [Thermus sp.]